MKSPEQIKMLEALSKLMTGKSNKFGKDCMKCGKDVQSETFRDELSKKEFKISGLCQGCQDVIFVEEKEIDW